jgi:hypothetical protein
VGDAVGRKVGAAVGAGVGTAVGACDTALETFFTAATIHLPCKTRTNTLYKITALTP